MVMVPYKVQPMCRRPGSHVKPERASDIEKHEVVYSTGNVPPQLGRATTRLRTTELQPRRYRSAVHCSPSMRQSSPSTWNTAAQ